MNIIELAKEAGLLADDEAWVSPHQEAMERFAALVRADLMKQVMDTCEAEYKMYDKMIDEDEVGCEECCALIHLMRKLDRLRPATGKAEALAEPVKQEPVAWKRESDGVLFSFEVYEGLTPLYAAPVDAKAIRALKLVYDNSTSHDWPEDIWEAIEEALK
jgi:hypothetical protein